VNHTISPRGALALLLTLGIVALLAVSLACGGGGDDDDGGDDGDDGVTPAATEPADDDGGDGDGDGGETTVDVSMGDNFFEPKDIPVPAGATVTFNLTNDGTAIHNMRVAGADNELNTDDDAVSEPSLFNAGDAGTIEWTAPDEPGVIDFQCDFHTTDMTGTITVE
jgi:plastocyanin